MYVGPDYGIVMSWNMDGCSTGQAANHWLLIAGAEYSSRLYSMGFMMNKVAPRHSLSVCLSLSQNIGFAPTGYHSANAVYYFSAFLPRYGRRSLMRRDFVTLAT